MIDYNYEIGFELDQEAYYTNWIYRIIETEGVELGALSYIFCSDEYLLALNRKYLQHDEYTDIITFNFNEGALLSGDIFISIPRVMENAGVFGVSFECELQRVMAHGVLHLIGYGDKTEAEVHLMRTKEDEMIKLFHVEH